MNENLQNEKSLPEVFYAKHMKAGVANYPEHNEVIYISNDTIADMAKGFEGKPVFVHHQDIDLENLKDQMDGVVSESFWNKYDGEWWVKFVAITDKAKQAIANGWGVSNCYDNLVRGNGGTSINVKYDSEIIGGKFNHLAIVENPRYEDAKIYTEQEYNNYLETRKDYIQQKKEQIQDYAKYLMLVSCGIFSVSFLFIEKITTPPINEKGFLLVSWICFSATVIILILSFLFSSKAFDKEIEILDSNQLGENKKVSNTWNSLVIIFNILSFIIFVIGFIFLFIFAYNNL